MAHFILSLDTDNTNFKSNATADPLLMFSNFSYRIYLILRKDKFLN